MGPVLLRDSWAGAALGVVVSSMSDPGLENVLWPQQTHLSVTAAWAEQEREPPQPWINQHQGGVDRLGMISRAAPVLISSTGCEQMSGKIQNRTSQDDNLLPEPVGIHLQIPSLNTHPVYGVVPCWRAAVSVSCDLLGASPLL